MSLHVEMVERKWKREFQRRGCASDVELAEGTHASVIIASANGQSNVDWDGLWGKP